MKKVIAGLVLFLNLSIAFSQVGDSTGGGIPLNPKVIYGKLDNGMTYYVMHNEKPANRASFYFVQNVGAILENDEQDGLAHFLEHMAFNGTENFPDKGLLKYLESYGVTFGKNINAYTDVDETVYNISNVPVTNENVIDSTLLILHDWSDYLTLDPQEIDDERGVISEEWRTKRTGAKRSSYKSREYIYQGSKYAKRDVIGSLDIINNFDHQLLRDFYHDYYRTDLQAVIVIGDIDAKQIEDKIHRLFSKIPAVKNPKERKYYTVPENLDPITAIISDPELSGVHFKMYIKQDGVPFENKNKEYIKENIKIGLFSRMINSRISEEVQTGQARYLNARIGYNVISRLNEAFVTQAVLNEENIKEGIQNILLENERILRYGFTQSELDRAKKAVLNSYENSYEGRDNFTNEDLVSQFKNHFLTKEPAPGMEYLYNFINSVLPEISLDEINSLVKNWYTDENRVIILQGPEKEGLELPAEIELLSIVNSVKSIEVSPYVDKKVEETLIENLPAAGKIISEKEVPESNALEWTLENGIKVVVKKTGFRKNEIKFEVFSRGGSSLYETSDLPSASVMSSFVKAYGLSDFDATTLKRMLTGKKVNVSPFLSTNFEGFSGSSSVKDFETLLQMVYLYFENPRFDKQVFDARMERYIAGTTNINNDYQKAFNDSIKLISNNYHERVLPYNREFVDQINFETIERIYRERFSNAGDFTFIFIGDLDLDKSRTFIERYLGSISTTDDKETWKDNNIRMPEEDIQKSIYMPMKDPKSTYYLKMHGENLEYSLSNSIQLNIVSGLLKKRYMETIREQEGGAYGVSVKGSINKIPNQYHTLTISFDTKPEKLDVLKKIVFSELDKLKAGEINSQDLNELKRNIIKVYSERQESNGFWMNLIKQYYKYDEDVMNVESYNSMVNGITEKEIKKFIKKHLSNANIIELVLSPEQ